MPCSVPYTLPVLCCAFLPVVVHIPLAAHNTSHSSTCAVLCSAVFCIHRMCQHNYSHLAIRTSAIIRQVNAKRVNSREMGWGTAMRRSALDHHPGRHRKNGQQLARQTDTNRELVVCESQSNHKLSDWIRRLAVTWIMVHSSFPYSSSSTFPCEPLPTLLLRSANKRRRRRRDWQLGHDLSHGGWVGGWVGVPRNTPWSRVHPQINRPPLSRGWTLATWIENGW